MAKNIKLTPSLLRRIVLEEKKKIMETLEQGKEESEKVSAEETDADELADACAWFRRSSIERRRSSTVD